MISYRADASWARPARGWHGRRRRGAGASGAVPSAQETVCSRDQRRDPNSSGCSRARSSAGARSCGPPRSNPSERHAATRRPCKPEFIHRTGTAHAELRRAAQRKHRACSAARCVLRVSAVKAAFDVFRVAVYEARGGRRRAGTPLATALPRRYPQPARRRDTSPGDQTWPSQDRNPPRQIPAASAPRRPRHRRRARKAWLRRARPCRRRRASRARKRADGLRVFRSAPLG